MKRLVQAGSVFVAALAFPVEPTVAQQDLQTWCSPEPMGHFATRMDVVGDIDADGWLDVVVASGPPLVAFGLPGVSYVMSSRDGHVLHAFPGPADGVAGAGDVDADGVPDIVIGDASLGLEPPGMVEIRSGLDGSILLHVDGSLSSDGFGYAVDGIGDLNGDGTGDIVVGAPSTSPHGTGVAGRVFVFSGADGLLIRQHHGSTEWGMTGHDVAGVGDVDGDGRPDYAFTDAQHLPSGMNLKQVRVVSGSTGATIHLFTTDVPTFVWPTNVDSIGDVDGDGVPDIAVGFPFLGPASEPAMVVYSGDSGAALLEVPGLSENLSGIGDVDMDGVPDIGVFAPPLGKPFSDPNGLTIVSGADGTLLYRLEGEGSFGKAFAGVGDLDADGRGDVLVGAPNLLIGPSLWGCITAVSLVPPAINGLSPDSVQIADVGSVLAQISGVGLSYVTKVKVGDTVLSADTSSVTILSPTLVQFVVPPTTALQSVPVSVSSTEAFLSNSVELAYVETHPPVVAVPGLAFSGEPLTWSLFGGAGDQGFLLVALVPATDSVQGWPLLSDPLVQLPLPLDALGTAEFTVVLPPAAYGLSIYSQTATTEGVLVGTSGVVWTYIA